MDQTAYELKEGFQEFKFGARTSFDYTKGRYDHVYEKAAALCEKHGLSPRNLIRAVFDGEDPNKALPLSLLGKDVDTKISKFKERVRFLEYADYLKVYDRWFENSKKQGFSEEEILMTSWIPFAAWYRICKPQTFNEKIFKRWQAACKEEYSEELRRFIWQQGMDWNRLLR